MSRVKTAVELSEDLLREIDERAGSTENRSEFIEAAVRAFIASPPRRRAARDREIIDRRAEDLNREALDVLGYQVDLWNRGDLYRVFKPSTEDPKRSRVFVVVSRQVLIESRFSTVICAPIYSAYDGLSTQVPIGVEEGLKHDSSIHCDELVSLPKAALTNFVGTLAPDKIRALSEALRVALDLPE